jgi:hypothetical protein
VVHLLVYHEVIVCGLLVPAEATEVISYGMPAFKYKGRLIGYAALQNFKRHPPVRTRQACPHTRAEEDPQGLHRTHEAKGVGTAGMRRRPREQ